MKVAVVKFDGVAISSYGAVAISEERILGIEMSKIFKREESLSEKLSSLLKLINDKKRKIIFLIHINTDKYGNVFGNYDQIEERIINLNKKFDYILFIRESRELASSRLAIKLSYWKLIKESKHGSSNFEAYINAITGDLKKVDIDALNRKEVFKKAQYFFNLTENSVSDKEENDGKENIFRIEVDNFRKYFDDNRNFLIEKLNTKFGKDFYKTIYTQLEGAKLNLEEYKEDEYDPRYFFFDSSIWFRFHKDAHLHDYTENNLFKIESNKWLNLKGSREYREFQIRLYKNSYISNDDANSPHGKYITPFSFHSETVSSLRTDRLIQKIEDKIGDNQIWTWKVLLVDDFAKKDIDKELEGTSKCDRITEILNVESSSNSSKFIKITDKLSINLEIETLDNLPAFEGYNSAISDDDFDNSLLDADIVLMDYLFVQNNDIVRSDLIVDKICKGERAVRKSQKHWILPVSAYNSAFIDKLLLHGIDRFNPYANISDGGDPICEPNLFRQKFFEIINNQLLYHITDENESLKDILKKIEEEDDRNKISKIIRSKYPKIFKLLQKFLRYNSTEYKTEFTNSVIENYYYRNVKNEEIIALQNFLYICGFDDAAIQDDDYRLSEFIYDVKEGSKLYEFMNNIYEKII